MPELPEVEVSKLGISQHLTNQVITDLIVRTPKLQWDIPTAELRSLIGQRIIAISRRAKYLVIETAGGDIIIHLGMSGSLRVIDSEVELKKHDHFDLVIHNKVLRLNDPRRFGALLFSPPNQQHPVFAKLGPEPLTDDFNPQQLIAMCAKRKAVIKQVIMDNPVVVGVGNIYANEALFLAQIDPRTPANQVTAVQLTELVAVIKIVLEAAIKQGGTTLKDFSQTDGKPGYFAQSLNVYGRGGLLCLHCKTLLEQSINNGTLSTSNALLSTLTTMQRAEMKRQILFNSLITKPCIERFLAALVDVMATVAQKHLPYGHEDMMLEMSDEIGSCFDQLLDNTDDDWKSLKLSK